jgi:hypothetical protein
MNSFALFRKRKEKKRIHLLFLAAGSPEMEKTMKPFNLNVKKCFYMFVDHDHHVLLVVKKQHDFHFGRWSLLGQFPKLVTQQFERCNMQK